MGKAHLVRDFGVRRCGLHRESDLLRRLKTPETDVLNLFESPWIADLLPTASGDDVASAIEQVAVVNGAHFVEWRLRHCSTIGTVHNNRVRDVLVVVGAQGCIVWSLHA